MTKQVNTVCGTSVGHIRSFRKLAPFLSRSALCTVISAILYQINYGNPVYLGLPAASLRKLQVILNDTARLVFNLWRLARPTPLLQDLHWLPVSQRIQFRILCVVFNALNTDSPAFVSIRLHRHTPKRLLRSSSACLLSVPRFKKVRSGSRLFSVLAL